MEKKLPEDSITPAKSTNSKKLFLPADFWSSVLATLDMKAQVIAEDYGYGKLNLTLIFHRGKVSEIYFTDEIRVKGILEKLEASHKSSPQTPSSSNNTGEPTP